MKEDEEKKMEVDHQKLVSNMIKSAGGGTSLLHKILNFMVWRGRVQILNEEEEDAKPFVRCEKKRKVGAHRWQCDTKVRRIWRRICRG